MSIKSYSELITLNTFIERYRYLRITSKIGDETFGHDRYLNQALYHSNEWLRFRDSIIVRDNGCDLGVAGHEISKGIIIHHINPISIDDILQRDSKILDPENAICTILSTHNAIHYGDENLLTSTIIERAPNDTCPWKK